MFVSLLKSSTISVEQKLAIAISAFKKKLWTQPCLFWPVVRPACCSQARWPTSGLSQLTNKHGWLQRLTQVSLREREGQCNNIEVFFNILSPDFHVTSACPACVLTCITAFFPYTAMLALSWWNPSLLPDNYPLPSDLLSFHVFALEYFYVYSTSLRSLSPSPVYLCYLSSLAIVYFIEN